MWLNFYTFLTFDIHVSKEILCNATILNLVKMRRMDEMLTLCLETFLLMVKWRLDYDNIMKNYLYVLQ